MAAPPTTTSQISLGGQYGYNSTGTEPMVGDPDIGLAIFSKLYTTNKLTLCQAVKGLFAYLAKQNSYDKQPPMSRLLDFVGHRLHPQDQIMVEVGYDGSVQRWIEAGNLPRGWYGLFAHNYAWYNPENERCIPQTTELETKTTVPASADSPPLVDIVPIMEPEETLQ